MHRLLKQFMDLIKAGHIKPIQPMKVFPFEDVASAFRYMRGATHIGKIVISNGSQKQIEVHVSSSYSKLLCQTNIIRSDQPYANLNSAMMFHT